MKKHERFLLLVIILFVSLSFTACDDSDYSQNFESSEFNSDYSDYSDFSNEKITDKQFNDNLKRIKIIGEKTKKYNDMIMSGKSLSKSQMKKLIKLGNELVQLISINSLYKTKKWQEDPNWVDPETLKSKADLSRESKKSLEDSERKLKEFEEFEKQQIRDLENYTEEIIGSEY